MADRATRVQILQSIDRSVLHLSKLTLSWRHSSDNFLFRGRELVLGFVAFCIHIRCSCGLCLICFGATFGKAAKKTMLWPSVDASDAMLGRCHCNPLPNLPEKYCLVEPARLLLPTSRKTGSLKLVRFWGVTTQRTWQLCGYLAST